MDVKIHTDNEYYNITCSNVNLKIDKKYAPNSRMEWSIFEIDYFEKYKSQNQKKKS